VKQGLTPIARGAGRLAGTHGVATQTAPKLSESWCKLFIYTTPLFRGRGGGCPCGFTSFSDCNGSFCGYNDYMESER
jgi:hypothetical protein